MGAYRAFVSFKRAIDNYFNPLNKTNALLIEKRDV